eukprot:gene4249-12398_t
MVPVFVLQFATVARLGDPTPIPSLNTNACMDVKLFNESSGDIVFLGEHDDFDSCNQAAAGSCSCTPGWSGLRCGTLNLLPVNKSKLGFREKNSTTGDNVSMGGPQRWFTGVASMHGNQTARSSTLSPTTHLVPFHARRLWPQVMLYAGYEYNATGLAACVCTSCKQGETPPQGTPGCPFQRGVPSNLGHPMKQMMAISDSPFGPWHTTEIKALTILLWTVTGNPYGNSVNFTDGSNFNFSRRERPHITWAPGKYGITPLALTNGVEYGTAPNTPFQDGTFSLMQAIVANL